MSHTVTHWTWVCVGLCLLTQSVLPHRALLGWCPSCWEQQPPCPFRRAPPPSSADRHTCSSLCSDNDDSEQSGMQHVWQWNPKQTAEYLTKYTLSSTVARGTYQLISCFFFPMQQWFMNMIHKVYFWRKTTTDIMAEYFLHLKHSYTPQLMHNVSGMCHTALSLRYNFVKNTALRECNSSIKE